MDAVLVGTDEGLVALGDVGAAPLEGPVTALTREGDRLWAVTGGHELWRSRDGGWQPVAESHDLMLHCVLSIPEGPLYLGTSEARLLRLADEALVPVASFDAAEGRSSWHTPWGGPPDTRSLSADLAGTLYANVHVGGVLRSDDDGASWVPTGIDIHADVHQVLAHPAEAETVLAACALGLARSRDAGESWEILDEGLHATYCRAVAAASDAVLVSASEGHHGRGASLYRLRGDRFEPCGDGLPEGFGDNLDTHCLAAAGHEAAVGTPEGGVFLSRDSGGSWEQLAEGLPRIRCVELLG